MFYEAFEQVIEPYDLNYHYNENDDCFYLTVYGKREIVGPLYGKLKKLGFDSTRTESSFGQRLHVTFNTNDFILLEKVNISYRIVNDVEVPLEINDLKKYQLLSIIYLWNLLELICIESW